MNKMLTDLYMVPGTMCNDQLWSLLERELEGQFRLLCLSLTQIDSIDALVDQMLAELPDTGVSLIGFSLGGYLASRFAVKYPERVARLLVVSNSPCALSDTEQKVRMETLNWVERFGYKGINRKKAISMLDPKSDVESIADIIVEMDNALGGSVLVQQLKNTTKRNDLLQPLLELAIPVSFYYSVDDPLINKPWLSNFKSQLPNAVFTEEQGSGHMLPLEKPEKLAEVIRQWCLI